MDPATAAASAPPFLATDVMAFVLGVIALVHAALWKRDREPGMGWFAIGMALMALIAATDSYHRPTGLYLPWTPWYLVLVAALMCLALGLVNYLNLPPALRARALWATMVPPAAYGALVLYVGLTAARIPRSVGQLPVGLAFLSMGVLAWQASRRERGAGHLFVAVSLLTIPVIAIAIALSKADSVALRVFAFGPLLVLAIGLVPVSLERRRRALEAEVARRRAAETALQQMNASLEQTVEQRTTDLRNVIAGLESFSRSVSHDLRGSLGGMGGLARLADEALQRGDSSLARRALPLIARQAEYATDLTASLLSLARVGDATLECEPVDLRQLVRGVIDQLALERGSQAMPAIEVEDMPPVRADPELLKPVFANLIGNAVKYVRDVGSGRVEIGASGSAGEVTVHVRDNGIGFDPKAASHLFAPFVRLHGPEFDGHGIGLSIVRRAVERHGGRVWAESEPGHGAVFKFTLPAAA